MSTLTSLEVIIKESEDSIKRLNETIDANFWNKGYVNNCKSQIVNHNETIKSSLGEIDFLNKKKESNMTNNFDVVKNYGFDDEEIIFNSDDFMECKLKCDEMHGLANEYDRYEVYPSDSMIYTYDQ